MFKKRCDGFDGAQSSKCEEQSFLKRSFFRGGSADVNSFISC